MDFKRLRIAVLSTALLCAANALAVATPKADSNTELILNRSRFLRLSLEKWKG